MKSVKQFLHSFGANGKGPERLKLPGEDGPVTTLDVRPDILVSTKKDFSIKNGCRSEAPDIRMATNASGKPFPVICNVRTKDLKASKLGTRNETSPPRSGGVRTFRKCSSTTDTATVPSDNQDRTCSQAAKRPSLTLRVSSVPSRPDELGPARTMLPPPMVTAALTKRRFDEPKPDPEKRERQDGGVKSQTSSSGLRTMKRSITERTPLNECVTRGDHNVNGLPQLDGHALTRIPRFNAAPVPTIPPRVQKPVAQKPGTLRRSTSDISQNGCAPSTGTHGSDRVNGKPPAPGAAAKGLLKPAASFTASKTNENAAAAATAGQAAVPSEDGRAGTTNHRTEAGDATGLEEAPPAVKTGGSKGKSKSRCQRRIWSFSLPRFMRSHSSPKLNTESVPSEESRSSTLPRLKSADDADLSAANGGDGHLFKITSLTSLHDLPAQAPPKTCFSQGDLNQVTTKATPCQRVVIREPPNESCRSGQRGRDADGNVQEAKTSSSLAESHSSSDNGTDHSGTERPYVMPPRALRKYIKTNFRRLNMQEAGEADAEKKDCGAVLKVIVKAEPPEQEALSTTSDKSAESATPSDSLLSSCSSMTRESNGSPKPEHYLKEREVPLETLSELTEKVVTDHTHTASYTKETETDADYASKTQQSSSLDSQRLSPPMTCFDVDAELFSEHAGIHRAIPATVTLISAVNRLSISESPGPRATPAAQEMDTEIPETLSETPSRVLVTSTRAPSVRSLDASEGSAHGTSEKTVTGNDGGGCPSTEGAPPAKGENVPEELDRQVDGASCTDSLSSFESEVTLPEKQERRTHAGISRKLRVLDRPSYGAGAATTRKPGAGTGSGCCSAGASASACCRRTANSKRQSCGERVRQLENEVWQTERELLLLKEKLLRGHGRHSSRPPDKSKSERDKGGGGHRANGNVKVATESTEVQCDATSNPESSLYLQDEVLSKVPGAECETTRRVHEENLLLQQELKEKCDLLSKLEEELDHRDDATALEPLDRTTPLPLNHRPQQREELRVTQEALSSLRQCFRLDDPYQHTLDTIEQSLCTLLERVTCMEKMAAAAGCSSTGSLRDGAARRLNFDSTGDPRRLPITTLEEYPGYRIESPASLGHCSQPPSTKVIYYTERSVTPFLSSIPKRLSDIRLRDFKVVFDRPGQYRFHFKTLDPEFGMVKEEVLHDDDPVPGWDGKIVAWIEEDI